MRPLTCAIRGGIQALTTPSSKALEAALGRLPTGFAWGRDPTTGSGVGRSCPADLLASRDDRVPARRGLEDGGRRGGGAALRYRARRTWRGNPVRDLQPPQLRPTPSRPGEGEVPRLRRARWWAPRHSRGQYVRSGAGGMAITYRMNALLDRASDNGVVLHLARMALLGQRADCHFGLGSTCRTARRPWVRPTSADTSAETSSLARPG